MPVCTVELRELRFYAGHGWHEEEQALGNEFSVSVLAAFPLARDVTRIDQTVNYAAAYKLVKKVFGVREALLESVAQKIAAALKAEFPVLSSVSITITKLNPMIEGFAGTAGICYEADFKP